MKEFKNEDLRGARFEDVRLEDARFRDVNLSGARFQLVALHGVVVRGAWLRDVEIDGEIESLRVNGVEVAPLVEAELDRLYPELTLLRPTDASGFREAWPVVEELWAGTVERARKLPEEQLHQRVDGEWSFIETLRHLVFATDAWVLRALLGDPSPYHPLDLPHDEMGDIAGVPRDLDARPSLDDVLAVREDRMETVRAVIADLTDARVEEMTTPVAEPGYPHSNAYPIGQILRTILSEEWWHRRYAERDLAILEADG